MRVRAQIQLDTQSKIMDFINIMTHQTDTFMVEDERGHARANASSMLGVIYASGDYGDQMYLVNETNDGVFPNELDKFRVEGR